MSSWKDAFRELALNRPFLRPLIGERFRHGWRPSGDALPAVTFFGVSKAQGHTLTEADGLPTVRIQVDCWASTAAGAEEIAEACRLSLDGFRGLMQPGDLMCQELLMLDGGADEFDPPQSGQGRGFEKVTLEFRLSFEETVPTF